MSNKHARVAGLAVLATTLVFSKPELGAQDLQSLEARMIAMQARYESRIAALESEVAGLRTHPPLAAEVELAATLDVTAAKWQQSGLSKAARDARSAAVQISVVADAVLTASGRRDSFETDNQFRLRSVELGFSGRLDPHAKYAFVLAAHEDAVEIEDAFADWDNGLPDTFTLRGGRMPVDFGFAAPLHDHELGFVDKPYAVQEFLGGRAVTTGLALHHWFGLGDTPVRWSLGAGNALQGDSHAIQGPLGGAHEHAALVGAEPVGERGIEDLIWTARVATTIDMAEHDTLTLGASVIHAPRERHFWFADPPTNTTVAFGDTDRTVAGMDVFWRHRNPATEGHLTIGGEWLWSRSSSVDDSTTPPVVNGTHQRADGGYVMAEYGLDTHWTVGGRWELFSHAEDRTLTTEACAVAVTWTLDEYNRLRLEAGLIDDESADDAYGFCMLQWTTVLGSHNHGLAW